MIGPCEVAAFDFQPNLTPAALSTQKTLATKGICEEVPGNDKPCRRRISTVAAVGPVAS